MKTHRFLLPALTALLLSSLPVLRADERPNRPDGPPPGERREQMGARMAEALGLNDDQRVRLKAIGDQERAEMQALREDAATAKEDRRAKAQAIHEKYKAQRDAVLTPEQRAKADKMRERMGDRMQERRERMENGGPGAERRQERREKAGK
jgi:periplasmic protein CpxP/Spy